MAAVLNELLERLERSFHQLRDFTSDVSHELRTPLASIRSLGEVGAQGNYEASKYRDIIGSMLEEVSRLTGMVDTLLTIAHAESGALLLKRSAIPIDEVVLEAVSIVRVLAEDKRQTIMLSVEDRPAISADRSFLRMALVNLLDNAVKYSPGSTDIRVFVRAATTDAVEPAMVEISVEDQGPGIPEVMRERVFDRFFRLDESRNSEAGGTGLGLAITKWAVEAHGGRVTVGSTGKEGAVFSMLLPTILRT